MKLSKGSLLKLLYQSNFRCFYCGTDVTLTKYEIDHIAPFSVSKNGTIDNMCVACVRCNRAKRDFTIEEFRERLSTALKRPIVFFFEHYGIVKERGFVRFNNTLDKTMY